MAVLHLERSVSRNIREPFDLELSKGELIHVHGNRSCSNELFGLIIGSSRTRRGTSLPQDRIGVAHWHESVGLITEVGFPTSLRTMVDLCSFCQKAYHQWDTDRFWRLCRELSLPKDKRLRRFSTEERIGASTVVALSHRSELILLPPASEEGQSQAVMEMLIREVRTGKAAALCCVEDPGPAAQQGTRHLLFGSSSLLLDCTTSELGRYKICSTTIAKADRIPRGDVVALFYSGKIAAKCIIEKDSAIDPTLGRVRDLELSDLTRWGEPV